MSITYCQASYFSLFGYNPSKDVTKAPTAKKVSYQVNTVIGGSYLLSVMGYSSPDKKGNVVNYFSVTIDENFKVTVTVPFVESKIHFDDLDRPISNLAYSVLLDLVNKNFKNQTTVQNDLWAFISIQHLIDVNYTGSLKNGFKLTYELNKVKTLKAWQSLLNFAQKAKCVPLECLANYASDMLTEMGENDPDPTPHKKEDVTDYHTGNPRNGGNNTPKSDSPDNFYDGCELTRLTLPQLKEYAESLGINVDNKIKKVTLIALIEDKLTSPVA